MASFARPLSFLAAASSRSFCSSLAASIAFWSLDRWRRELLVSAIAQDQHPSSRSQNLSRRSLRHGMLVADYDHPQLLILIEFNGT